jgi:hypothetical protein
LKKLKYLFIAILIIAISTVILDVVRISSYKSIPRKPRSKTQPSHNQIYYDLANGKEDIDWSQLDGTLYFIQKEYDCSDFRLVNLTRILYEHEDQVPDSVLAKIKKTLLGFRYWWDEPGENSMCYWSENHQILFASAEYLIGQKYPHVRFRNSGMTGKEHMEKAKKRTLDWLEMRWNYGFTEFFSSVYYKEDIGALINLIDFAENAEIVTKSEIILDLLFYDVAAQNIKTMFISASGRAYRGNRMGGPGSTLGGLTSHFWENESRPSPGMLYGMKTTRNYKLPPVLIDIAKDTNNVVIKQNHGLNISDLKKEGYFGTDDKSMMMQWGMEAFTNPEIVRNSIAHIRNKNMFSNNFISEFKVLDFSIIRLFHLEPAIVRVVNPPSNGVAIQQGNTYTFKTQDHTLYSVQKYFPGTFGDQHHVAGMNIGNSFSIFHTHPAVEKGVKKQSPNYWVGYGHLPHVAQDSSVSLAIYNIPDKKSLKQDALLDYTHAYFPKEKFDSVYVDKNYAMGKKGNTYCAVITNNDLSFRENTTDDLIQKGKQTFWIIEAGSKHEDQSFNNFCKIILNNTHSFDSENLVLEYISNKKKYKLKFGGDFHLNDKLIDVNYKRYNSPYSNTERKAKTITFDFNNKFLHLDFYNMKRDF